MQVRGSPKLWGHTQKALEAPLLFLGANTSAWQRAKHGEPENLHTVTLEACHTSGSCFLPSLCLKRNRTWRWGWATRFSPVQGDASVRYHKNPPDLEKWDGSEHLNKKAWVAWRASPARLPVGGIGSAEAADQKRKALSRGSKRGWFCIWF